MARRSAPPAFVRAGFSLLEVLLVLALLVVLAALVVPALEGPLAGERLRRSADQLRTAWTRARIRAMQSGEIYAFTFDPDAGTYRIAPLEALQAAPAGPGGDASVRGPAGASTGQLPEDVVFYLGAAADPSGRADSPGLQADNGAPLIVFYPDGTSSTAEVWLRNETAQAVPVLLRGLTGVSRVGDVTVLEDRP
jgi:prepilin-type N-terminal cleavage/methylation domain-containing protein